MEVIDKKHLLCDITDNWHIQENRHIQKAVMVVKTSDQNITGGIKLEKRFEQWCPEYIATGFVAEHCGVSKVTVVRWIEKGRLAAFRLPDSHYRIHREDFAEFLTKYGIPVRQGASGNKSSGRHTQ